MTANGAERRDHPPAPNGAEALSVVHLVLTAAFAGVERYVCEVANGLASRGNRVVVIGGDPRRMPMELRRDIRHRAASSVPLGAWALSTERHVDVIHVHMTAGEFAGWLARPVQRAPLVATRHFARHRGSSAVARALATITSRSISCDIAISQFVADSIGGPSILLANGVHERPQAALESKTVVMLQRLNEEKSPEVGIRAWSSSGLGANGWRLVIAGAGDRGPSLARLAQDLDLSDSIDFVGQVVDTDDLLEGAAVFLAPAPEEPFGLSVVEAMAHGIPVVAARGGAHVETVGDDGLLFAPGDPAAAAEALVTLGGELALRRTIGKHLQERQRRLFSLERHLDGLESVYRRVIDEPRRRPRLIGGALHQVVPRHPSVDTMGQRPPVLPPPTATR